MVCAIAAFVVLISFLIWWLYGRLICLEDEDRCVIGAALGKPSPDPAGKAATMIHPSTSCSRRARSTFLRPKTPAPTIRSARGFRSRRSIIGKTFCKGEIVTPNQKILGIGRGYVSDAAHARYLKSIHSEFEGSGIRNLLAWANVILALLIARFSCRQFRASAFSWLGSP